MTKCILWVALVLLLLPVLLLGCSTPEPTPSDEPSDDPPAPETTLDIIKDGESTFRIIRPELWASGGEGVMAAVELRQAIGEYTGCMLPITTDWDDQDNNDAIFEIVIGDTNRAISSQIPSDAPKNAYYIIAEGNKIYIGGANEQATARGVDYFIDTYVRTATAGTLSIPVALRHEGSFTFKYPTQLFVIHTIKSVLDNEISTVEYNDMVRLISSLQGRVNKNAPNTGIYLYQMFDGFDAFWLDYISEDGKLLEKQTRRDLGRWEEVWEVFGSTIKDAGLVVWDPNAPATANVAATVCSVEGYLPVRYDTGANSLYTWLTKKGVEVKLSLVDMFDGKAGTTIADTDIPSTGSIKCDPYLWALEKYGERVNSSMIGYILDGATTVAENPMYQKAQSTNPDWNQLYSHDYLIYNECFFVDLTCVEDELPCDDPSQPMGTDAKTLKTILQYFYDKNNGKMAKLMGFPPWYLKYSNYGSRGKLNPTELEFAFTATITQYNFAKEADAAHPAWMTNGSVYTHYVSTASYENTTAPLTEEFDEETYYFTIYMGDYDSSAWFKSSVPIFFMQDEDRGRYPLMWAFNPNLGDRVPMVFDYVYENATENDYFVTGDSGAGYINPDMLPDLDTWVEYNEPYLAKYDMDIVGFIITSQCKINEEIMEAYAKIAPVGSFHNDITTQLVVYNNETVYMHLMNEIIPSGDDFTPRQMYEYLMGNGTNFAAYRAVNKSPTAINEAIDKFIAYAQQRGVTVKCVDPYTLFDLVLQSGQGEYIYGE
ncbi:MAG: hypothetical protein IJW40_08230 [Clostridia bacterium]|nr:hypothetical protein [Clostridia bacterium]